MALILATNSSSDRNPCGLCDFVSLLDEKKMKKTKKYNMKKKLIALLFINIDDTT